MPKSKKSTIKVGWREWVGLPEFESVVVKAKIDTGARSSSLHVANVEYFESEGCDMVRFEMFPRQLNDSRSISSTARVIEFREVKSSNGQVSNRPVILIDIILGSRRWPIEVTLADRKEMKFRMLLGREALRTRCLINPEKSFVQGKPEFPK